MDQGDNNNNNDSCGMLYIVMEGRIQNYHNTCIIYYIFHGMDCWQGGMGSTKEKISCNILSLDSERDEFVEGAECHGGIGVDGNGKGGLAPKNLRLFFLCRLAFNEYLVTHPSAVRTPHNRFLTFQVR